MYYFEKTPLLGAGLAKNMMRHFLAQVKSHRGLTSFIERKGVNGKWVNPERPYNIRLSKFMKIMENKAHYQNDDEFLDEWQALGELFLEQVRQHHLIHFL